MKKLISILVAAAMLLCCTAFADEAVQTIALGTSGLAIEAPASYVKGEMTAEDTEDNQVAYYCSEELLVDFDIYQWAKADGETLSAAAAEEAAAFGAEAAEDTINGIAVACYIAVEESEGENYTTYTFLAENGDFFAEIVFWADGEDAEDVITSMMATLKVVGTGLIDDQGDIIALGTTSYTMTLPAVYQKGVLTAEDTNENQVAYYFSTDCLVDFDVYQWAKADGETVASAAAEEAAAYSSEAAEITIGDVTASCYAAVEESEGVEYVTFTVLLDADTDIVEVVFWMDGENAEAIVDAVVASITK